MTIGGVDPVVGFILPTTEEIGTSIRARMLVLINALLDLSPDQPMGQIVDIFSDKLATAWQALQTAYNGFNPDAAEGFLLDADSALTGTLRPQATPSVVVCDLVLALSTTVPAGSLINDPLSPSVFWALQQDVVSTSAGTYQGTFACQTDGPVQAIAGALTVITNPVTGWTSVTNGLDAIEGTNEASDATLRQLRVQELTASGASTVDAMRADLLEITGMLQAFVYENTGDVVSSDGIPPHSFEAVIYDGVVPAVANSTVAQTIWDNHPSGNTGVGSLSGTAFDSFGNPQTVFFSRAAVKPVYLNVSIITNSQFPANGITAVKAAIANWAQQNLTLDSDVIALAVKAQALTVPGVVDVPLLQLDFTSSPTNVSNLTVTRLQIATIDTTNISVNGS